MMYRQVTQIRVARNIYERYGVAFFLLIGRDLDGTRPLGCPNSRELVLAMSCFDWYRIADHFEWHTWRKNGLSLGQCRELWCSTHGVGFLTYDERHAVEAVPTV